MRVKKKVKQTDPKTSISRLDWVFQALLTESLSDTAQGTTSGYPHVITTHPHYDIVMMEDRSPNGEDPNMSQDNDLPTDDRDSAFGDELPDTTVPASKEVFEIETIYNRGYYVHFQREYPYPNDKREQERQTDFHHRIKAYLAGEGPYGDHGLFSAPFNTRNGANILDIATGPGDWPIDMGDKFPEATITGIDLSPIQPRDVPPNVNFVVDDVELSWDDSVQYDYVHCRNVGGCMQNFPLLIKRIYEHLELGGWVEFHELSMKFRPTDNKKAGVGKGLSKLVGILDEACTKMDRTLDPTRNMKRELEKAGFTRIQRRTIWLPVGEWPVNTRDKEIGTAVKRYLSDGLQAMTAVPVRGHLGWSREDTELLCAGARNDLIDGLCVGYKCVIAQKGT